MNSQLLAKIEKPQLKKVPELKAGDTVRVHQKITEGKKERVQVFEGVVLRVKGGGLRQSFLVRKISFGIGVEKNFLIHAPNIVKIEIKKRAKVRRAYLTYLRALTGKKARLKDKQFDSLVVNIQEDKEVTPDPIEDAEIEEVPLSELEKAEEKEAAEAAGESNNSEEGGQEAEIAEVKEGLEEAEKDAEKGKDKKELKAEESKEEKQPE